MSDVLMPQMGESVAEGTIVRWIKQVGERVEKDEPLFEISTDKVDAEIPSPDAGIVLEIRVKEGETVEVNSVVAVIGQAGDIPAARPVVDEPSSAAGRAIEADAGAVAGTNSSTTVDDLRRTRSSPLVRKIAQEHGIDITQLAGSGLSGRVTKKDIVAFIDSGGRSGSRAPKIQAPGTESGVEPMSVIRRKIAEHMVASVRTSPHVYSTVEVDFSRVDALRNRKKAEYERAGTKLTFTAFLTRATAEAIHHHPFINASVDGDTISYHQDINLGIAVALEQGLIVPVIRRADTLSMMQLSRAIQDLAGRARSKQLKHDEVQNGTFTITNPGTFGVTMGLPIINQPQVAILAVGSVEKRVVVVDDMIAVRPMAYITLGHDHRLIDGADAGRFLQTLKERLEDFDDSTL